MTAGARRPTSNEPAEAIHNRIKQRLDAEDRPAVPRISIMGSNHQCGPKIVAIPEVAVVDDGMVSICGGGAGPRGRCSGASSGIAACSIWQSSRCGLQTGPSIGAPAVSATITVDMTKTIVGVIANSSKPHSALMWSRRIRFASDVESPIDFNCCLLRFLRRL